MKPGSSVALILDSTYILYIFDALFDAYGCQTERFTTGEEFIEALKQRSFDAVVFSETPDMTFANFIKWCQTYRQEGQHYFVANAFTDEERIMYKRQGIQEMISPPINPHRLEEMIMDRDS